MQAQFFKFLERYYNTVNAVLPRHAFDGMLQRSVKDAGRKALYLETYDDFQSLKVDDADFHWSVHELKELAAEQAMRGALEQSMEVLTKGIEDKDGEIIKGQEAARDLLLERLSEIDATLAKEEAPHGNMRDEGDLILREYQERLALKRSGKVTGINFGISELDRKVGGMNRGDLVLAAAYSNDGKSSLCVQLAWSAMVQQQKNVLFLTTETVNTTIRRKIISRHSKASIFSEFGLPEGLNSRNLKEGTFSPPEEDLFKAVVEDFTTNENYGQIYIHQVPPKASMDVVERIMNRVQKSEFPLDLVVIDYLALLRPIGFRNTDRESLSGILKNAKQIATTFNKGEGVPIVSPWQVNRAERERAMNTGQYSLQAMAETAEATNTPDLIVSILAPMDNTNRYAEVTGQVLKHRDGETANGLLMDVDYATSEFKSRLGLGSMGGSTFGGGSGGLDDLIA